MRAASRQRSSARWSAPGTFARGGVSKLLAPFQIAAGVVTALWRMWREQPACVAGFGGYPALPAMTAAWLLKRPRLVHEQNGVLGRVNEVFATRVDRVACGTWPTALPEGAVGVHTGNPIRSAVLDRAASPYTPPGDWPLKIVVMGGSQGARVLSDVVPAALADLPDNVRAHLTVSHQAREEDHDRVVAAYAACRHRRDRRCVLCRRPRPAGRGAVRDFPVRRLVGGGHRGDRAAVDPDPAGDRQAQRAGGERPRSGRGRRCNHADRGGVLARVAERCDGHDPERRRAGLGHGRGRAVAGDPRRGGTAGRSGRGTGRRCACQAGGA